MNLLIKKEQEFFVQNVVMFAKKSLKINMLKIKKKIKRLETIIIMQVNTEVQRIAYVI